MTQRTLFIAAYDITAPDRLRAALKVLRDYSTGGQKSVFECFLSDTEKRELLLQVAAVIDAEEDRFLLMRLELRVKVVTLGIAVAPVDPDFYYVG